MNKLFPLALPLMAALVLYATDLTQTLGAHPWWAVRVIWIGVCLGLLISAMLWGLRVPYLIRLSGLIPLTLAAIAITYTGKIRFAASFAEDTLAGQMWYFGWMAICTFALAVMATAVWPDRQRH